MEPQKWGKPQLWGKNGNGPHRHNCFECFSTDHGVENFKGGYRNSHW